MGKRLHKWSRRIFRAIFAVVLVFSVVGSFGVLTHDETIFRSFAEAAIRWQHNPEFRSAAMEYCVKGSAATRARVLGFTAGQLVMVIRSLPGMPKRYAVNDTSKQHYADFNEGPLSGYLHLCDEQKVPAMVSLAEAEAKKNDLSLDAMGRMLGQFRMDSPVRNDEGAQQSAASVLRDSEASRPFTVRDSIVPLLKDPIVQIANALHVPTEPKDMSPEQQQWVLDRLDHYVYNHDRELWRTKQLSDFFGGIWAQVYGPDYNMLIVPIMETHRKCTVLLVFLLTLLAIDAALRLRKLAKPAPAPNPEPLETPSPDPGTATATA